MRKHQPLRVIFGKSSPFYLPKFLDRFGVSPEMVNDLLLVEQPQVVNALIHEVFAGLLERNRAALLQKELRRQLARYRHESKKVLGNRKMGAGEKSRLLMRLYINDSTVALATEELRKAARRVIGDAHLYWDGETDTVRSTLVGCFSYDPDDNGVKEDVVDIECTHCGYTEMEVDTSENWEECLQHFEHISGPYFRCPGCDSINRVKQTGQGSYYYEPDELAWDYYVDWLQEGLDAVASHLQKHGLPAPAGLIGVGQGVDWRGRSGQFTCGFSGKELADSLRVNGSFSIHGGEIHTYPNGSAELRCTMYHHDVPTGAPFSIVPYYESEAGCDHEIPAERMWQAAEFGKVYHELAQGLHDQRWAWWTKSGLEQVRYVVAEEISLLCNEIIESSFDQTQDVGEHDPAIDGLAFAIVCLINELAKTSNFQLHDGSYNFSRMRDMASNINALLKCYYGNQE